jgi:hypothetical protein
VAMLEPWALFGSSSAVEGLNEAATSRESAFQPVYLRRWLAGALAGLEPATCCLGDVSAQTLCCTTKFLVSSNREAKVIVSSDRGEVSRYPARTPAAASGHIHTRAVSVQPQDRLLSLGEP